MWYVRYFRKYKDRWVLMDEWYAGPFETKKEASTVAGLADSFNNNRENYDIWEVTG